MLAGIMTTFGAPTGAVPIDGNGEFDGLMLASFSKPRIEGTFRGDRLRAWDVVWGTGDRRRRDREQLRDRGECRADVRRVGDPRRRPVLARLSAQGSGRGDRRARAAQSAAAGRSSARVPAGRLPDGGPGVGRLPPLRAVRAAVRLRQHGDRPGRRVRRDVRARDVVAALRGERRAARLARDHEEHRHGDRRRVRRLGRRLLLQRGRRPDSGRIAEDGRRFRRRRCPGCCSSTPAAPARSRSRATT